MSGVWEMFEKIKKLGEGSYGSVYLAKTSSSNRLYAIKLLKSKKDNKYKYCDLPYTSLREVSILKEIEHPNVVKLLRVYFDHYSFGMIFDYHPTNLKHFLKEKKGNLSPGLIKKLIKGIISGVDHLHQNAILHRDLKPENILISETEEPLLADFGLSRIINQPLREYTNEVMTLNYRAPELVFGETCYSIGIDLWALGCIIAEIFLGRPLFKATCSPTLDNCPRLPIYLDKIKTGFKVPKNLEGPKLKELLGDEKVDPRCIDLISRFLMLDANRRITCKEALNHCYFQL